MQVVFREGLTVLTRAILHASPLKGSSVFQSSYECLKFLGCLIISHSYYVQPTKCMLEKYRKIYKPHTFGIICWSGVFGTIEVLDLNGSLLTWFSVTSR